jgi:hypothetical protein
MTIDKLIAIMSVLKIKVSFIAKAAWFSEISIAHSFIFQDKNLFVELRLKSTYHSFYRNRNPVKRRVPVNLFQILLSVWKNGIVKRFFS